jgi:hypothetical protein
MPGELETYIDLYQAAEKAWQMFYAALQDATMKLAQVRLSPHLLASPALGKWPSQDQLYDLWVDASSKTNPLRVHYGQIHEKYRASAKAPHNLGKEPI